MVQHHRIASPGSIVNTVTDQPHFTSVATSENASMSTRYYQDSETVPNFFLNPMDLPAHINGSEMSRMQLQQQGFLAKDDALSDMGTLSEVNRFMPNSNNTNGNIDFAHDLESSVSAAPDQQILPFMNSTMNLSRNLPALPDFSQEFSELNDESFKKMSKYICAEQNPDRSGNIKSQKINDVDLQGNMYVYLFMKLLAYD